MSAAVITMMLGLFAIPWTLAGLINPSAVWMKGASRLKIMLYGSAAFLTLLAIAVFISSPHEMSGAEASSVEGVLGVVWLLACVIWPFIALVGRTNNRAALLHAEPADTPVGDRAAPEIELSIDECRAVQHQAQPATAPKPVLPSTECGFLPDAELAAEEAADNDRFAHLHPEPINPQVVTFIYENSQGELSRRQVTVDQVGTSHFAGFCNRDNEQRTFRFDRIQGNATCQASGNVVQPRMLRDLLRGYDAKELRRQKRAQVKTASEILFTGFKQARRAELEAQAEAAGMHVVKRVTENLDLLCGGYNAGPSKLAEARSKGVIVLNEGQFEHLLATGEIPS